MICICNLPPILEFHSDVYSHVRFNLVYVECTTAWGFYGAVIQTLPVCMDYALSTLYSEEIKCGQINSWLGAHDNSLFTTNLPGCHVLLYFALLEYYWRRRCKSSHWQWPWEEQGEKGEKQE